MILFNIMFLILIGEFFAETECLLESDIIIFSSFVGWVWFILDWEEGSIFIGIIRMFIYLVFASGFILVISGWIGEIGQFSLGIFIFVDHFKLSIVINCVEVWMFLVSLFSIVYGSVRQWPGRPGFNPWSSHTKDSKNRTWCFLA